MPMELRDLSYFCMAAEMEHITKAAKQLGVAQPFLTKIIKQIEDEVGGELFEKTGRGVRLNRSGRLFYKQAKKTLADMDTLYSEMDYAFEHKERTITLLSNTEAFFFKLIDAFEQTKAGYTFCVRHASKEAITEALIRGEGDFALTCPPIEEDEAVDIVTEKGFYEVGCILLPPGHRLIGKKKVDITELRGEPLITMPHDSAMRYKLDPIFEKYDIHPEIMLETNNNDLIIHAVNSGWGYAYLTTLIMDSRSELLERCIIPDIPEIKGYFGLSYNKHVIERRNAKSFRDFLSNFLKELGERLYGDEEI